MSFKRFDKTVVAGTSDTHSKAVRWATMCLVAATCCLLATAIAPRRALAQDGSLTVLSRQRGDPTYAAYQVFAADVDGAGIASHVAWASQEVRDDVLEELDGAGYGEWLTETHPGAGQRELAQNAAEFIGGLVGQAGPRQAGLRQPSRTLLISLARSLETDERVKAVALAAGSETMVPQGHWIVLSSSDGSAGIAHSTPLWVTVGSEPVAVNEKADTPTIDKQVRDPSDGNWKKAATVHIGQVCSFRIVSTLPSTLSAYEHYPYCVTDRIPVGCDLAVGKGTLPEDAVTVSVGGKEVKPDGTHLIVSYEKRTLSVSFDDLADTHWDGFDLGPDKNVLINYSAILTRGASSAEAGNVNSATLSYPNDPLHQTIVHTGETRACLLTHVLTLRKLDGKTGKPLAGARFTIQRDASGGDIGRETYVQADGSMGSSPHSFATGRNGIATVSGIGQGSYRIVEEMAPDGYRKINDSIPLEISATVDAQTQRRTELTARTSSDTATVEAVDAKEGSIVLAITNEPETQLPAKTTVEKLAQTGVGPIAASLAGTGLVVIALSLATKRDH